MKRKWRENEEMEREIHSQDFLIFCLFPPYLSISYIKNCHILSQNVKYSTFVANVTKNLTYTLQENNSGWNSLRESSASCAGLFICKLFVICDKGQNSNNIFPRVFPQSEIVCRHFERHLVFKRFRVCKKIQKQVLISFILIYDTCYC